MRRAFKKPATADRHLITLARHAAEGKFWVPAFTLDHINLETTAYDGKKNFEKTDTRQFDSL